MHSEASQAAHNIFGPCLFFVYLLHKRLDVASRAANLLKAVRNYRKDTVRVFFGFKTFISNKYLQGIENIIPQSRVVKHIGENFIL